MSVTEWAANEHNELTDPTKARFGHRIGQYEQDEGHLEVNIKALWRTNSSEKFMIRLTFMDDGCCI